MRKENRDRGKERQRERNRDGGGDWNRDRDRNRRDRGQRRDRDVERSQNSGGNGGLTGTSQDCVPVLGPVVLLKRPEASYSAAAGGSSSPAASSTSGKESGGNNGGKVEREGTLAANPTAILLRSGQWRKGDSYPDLRTVHAASSGSGSTTSAETPVAEMKLKTKPAASQQQQQSTSSKSYRFPDYAIPIVNSTKDMKVEADLDFINANANCTDFFVVTAIGVPHSGKSTLLSFLGGRQGFGEACIFQPRKVHQQKECTVYMTPHKVILIEMASVFNGAVASDMMNLMGPQGTLETAAIAWNLRIMSWALAVSHVVILVSEQLLDPNLLQLINTASIVYPTDSVFGDGAYAELVYVCNKASASLLEETNTHSYSARQDAQSVFNSALGRPLRIAQNFFALPHLQWQSNNDYENFKSKLEDFIRYNRATYTQELKDVKRFPQNVTLTDWHQASMRVWEDFHQNSGFHSYMKLLP